jgi:hypothetical protein
MIEEDVEFLDGIADRLEFGDQITRRMSDGLGPALVASRQEKAGDWRIGKRVARWDHGVENGRPDDLVNRVAIRGYAAVCHDGVPFT